MARGRTGRSSRCIPRAIAPEVTTITLTPEACSEATSSHTRATADRRKAPASSATTDDPSFTTATAMNASLERRARVQLEDRAADLDLVAGLESCPLERRDHAHPVQPPLHQRLCLLVLQVVARDQALDRLAGNDPLAGVRPRDVERARRARTQDGELGHVVLPRPLRHR